MAKILIVDDERAIRNTLKEILEYEKYKVEEAEDGQKGLEMIQENSYDVVLLDIKMPKMDGIEVLEKAIVDNPDTPFIMISGHGNLETAVDCVKKGAYDYLQKPPDLNRLLITVRNALDKSKFNY
ncbi:MAG: response regulator [Chitinophagales bacterium]|nr:response regulator [Chitinophagales bacterium]